MISPTLCFEQPMAVSFFSSPGWLGNILRQILSQERPVRDRLTGSLLRLAREIELFVQTGSPAWNLCPDQDCQRLGGVKPVAAFSASAVFVDAAVLFDRRPRAGVILVAGN